MATNMSGGAAAAGAGLLDPRCAQCGELVDGGSPGINIGDLRYHAACAPRCATCGRRLRSGDVGWVVQGNVVSTPWGYSVHPTTVWCPDCLEAVPRAEPVALD
jgi:hypothetical protein